MTAVTDVTELADRVRTAVAAEHRWCQERGYEGPMPLHGEAGGAKWRVDSDDPERPDWEGGYECHCGEVFVATVEQGGMRAAFTALTEHQGGKVLS